MQSLLGGSSRPNLHNVQLPNAIFHQRSTFSNKVLLCSLAVTTKDCAVRGVSMTTHDHSVYSKDCLENIYDIYDMIYDIYDMSLISCIYKQ